MPQTTVSFVIRKLLSISHGYYFSYKPLRNTNYDANGGARRSTNYELRRPIDENNKNPLPHRTSCRAPFAAMNTLYIRAIRSTILGAIVMAALIFLPTGTLNYWQGWVFFALFLVASRHRALPCDIQSGTSRTPHECRPNGGKRDVSKNNHPFRVTL